MSWDAAAEAVIIAKRMAARFPKACGCGRQHTAEGWAALEWAYNYADEFAEQEARQCVCGSTLSILTKILDLSQE